MPAFGDPVRRITGVPTAEKPKVRIVNDHAQYVAAKWLPANQLRNALFEILLAVVAVVVVAISIFLQAASPERDWFRCSWAIVVLVGAIMEYRHNKLMHSIDIESIKWASGVGDPTVFQPNFLRKVVGYIAHVFVIVGTFMAAYGDLIVWLGKGAVGLLTFNSSGHRGTTVALRGKAEGRRRSAQR